MRKCIGDGITPNSLNTIMIGFGVVVVIVIVIFVCHFFLFFIFGCEYIFGDYVVFIVHQFLPKQSKVLRTI